MNTFSKWEEPSSNVDPSTHRSVLFRMLRANGTPAQFFVIIIPQKHITLCWICSIGHHMAYLLFLEAFSEAVDCVRRYFSDTSLHLNILNILQFHHNSLASKYMSTILPVAALKSLIDRSLSLRRHIPYRLSRRHNTRHTAYSATFEWLSIKK